MGKARNLQDIKEEPVILKSSKSAFPVYISKGTGTLKAQICVFQSYSYRNIKLISKGNR